MAQERSDAGGQAEGRQPSDTESLVGETAASERLTDPLRVVQPGEAAERRAEGAGGGDPGAHARIPTGEDSDREAELGHS